MAIDNTDAQEGRVKNLARIGGYLGSYDVTFFLMVFICSAMAYKLGAKKSKKGGGGDSKSVTFFPPEPNGCLPLVGHIPIMAVSPRPHILMQGWWEKYGDVYQIRLATRPAVVINGQATIREAFLRKAEDFSGRPDFYPWQLINEGRSFAFGAYDSQWRCHKRLASKAMKMFVDDAMDEQLIVDAAVQLTRDLLEKGGEPQVAHYLIHMSCAKTIFRIIFGAHFQPERSDAFFRFKDHVLEDFVNFVGPNNPINILPWTRFLLKEKCQIFRDFIGSIADFVRGQAKEHSDTLDENNLRDILDALLMVSKDIPNGDATESTPTTEELFMTCTDLLEGGATSIITFLNWAILYRIRNPKIFARVLEEIDNTLGPDQTPIYQDHLRMPYVEAVMSEIFRHSSFASGTLPHMTTNDTVLNGYFIPKDTLVLCNLHSVTRDTAVWDDPETFNPSRFINEDGSINKSLIEAIPSFGIGRRRCLGERIAKVKAFLFFVILMQKCTFRAPEGGLKVEIVTDVAIEPKPYEVVVEHR